MIIVLVSSSIAPEKETEFIESVKSSKVLEGCRNEVGNVSYDLVQIVGEAGKLLMIERWENMESLKAHTSGHLFKKITEISSEFGVISQIKLFNAEELK